MMGNKWGSEMNNEPTDELKAMVAEFGHVIKPTTIEMPRELTDKQADIALAATAKFLDIKGSQLTVNREKMKARYRALVTFIESQERVEL